MQIGCKVRFAGLLAYFIGIFHWYISPTMLSSSRKRKSSLKSTDNSTYNSIHNATSDSSVDCHNNFSCSSSSFNLVTAEVAYVARNECKMVAKRQRFVAAAKRDRVSLSKRKTAGLELDWLDRCSVEQLRHIAENTVSSFPALSSLLLHYSGLDLTPFHDTDSVVKVAPLSQYRTYLNNDSGWNYLPALDKLPAVDVQSFIAHYRSAFPFNGPIWDPARFNQDRRLEMEVDWLRSGMYKEHKHSGKSSGKDHSGISNAMHGGKKRFTYLEVWCVQSGAGKGTIHFSSIIEFEVIRFVGGYEFEAVIRRCDSRCEASVIRRCDSLCKGSIGDQEVSFALKLIQLETGCVGRFKYNFLQHSWNFCGRSILLQSAQVPPDYEDFLPWFRSYYYRSCIDWNEKYLGAWCVLNNLSLSDLEPCVDTPLADGSLTRSLSNSLTASSPIFDSLTKVACASFCMSRNTEKSVSDYLPPISPISDLYRWIHSDFQIVSEFASGFYFHAYGFCFILPSGGICREMKKVLQCSLSVMRLNPEQERCMDYLQCPYRLRYFVDRLHVLDVQVWDCLHIGGILDLIASYLPKF